MRNYSSNRAQKGKTAYRTPSRFKVHKSLYEKIKKGNYPEWKKTDKKIFNF